MLFPVKILQGPPLFSIWPGTAMVYLFVRVINLEKTGKQARQVCRTNLTSPIMGVSKGLMKANVASYHLISDLEWLRPICLWEVSTKTSKKRYKLIGPTWLACFWDFGSYPLAKIAKYSESKSLIGLWSNFIILMNSPFKAIMDSCRVSCLDPGFFPPGRHNFFH